MPFADRPRQTSPAEADDEDDDDGAPTHYQFKVVVLGDGTVGKTSLCLRCTQDHHSHTYKQTIGVDFYIKQLTLPGGVNVAMQLWDIGGQTLGGKMVANYIFGCQAVLLVYDVTNYQSFLDLEDWLAMVQAVTGRHQLPYIAVVANKCDLGHLRAVRLDRHSAFANSHRLYSYQVSARTGDSTTATMYRVAGDLAGVPLSNSDVEALLGVVHSSVDGAPAYYCRSGGGIGSLRAYSPTPDPSLPSHPHTPDPLLPGRQRKGPGTGAARPCCSCCWPAAWLCGGCCCGAARRHRSSCASNVRSSS